MADIDFDALLATAAPAIKGEDYADRVKRGAVWLDEVQPDWYTKVDAETLNMQHGCKCIIGQVYGDFWYAIHSGLGEPAYDDFSKVCQGDTYSDRIDTATELGFFCDDADDEGWGLLIEPWVQAIEERRACD